MDKSCHQYALWLGLCGYKYISLGGQLVINYDCLSHPQINLSILYRLCLFIHCECHWIKYPAQCLDGDEAEYAEQLDDIVHQLIMY